MKYTEVIGDYKLIYEGTPEEIATLKHLIDNEMVVVKQGEETTFEAPSLRWDGQNLTMHE